MFFRHALKAVRVPTSHLSPQRWLSSSSVSCSQRNVNLAGLVRASANDVAHFRQRTSGGFTQAHGVSDTVTPAAYDKIPPINSRGGRDVGGWRALYEGVVAPNWTNLHGTMHGACAAWLVDNLTGRAVETLSTEDWWGAGVSISLDMTYQSPAPVGMKLDILVTVDRMTGSIGYTRCEMFDQATGERIASGNHVLMWRRPKKPSATV